MPPRWPPHRRRPVSWRCRPVRHRPAPGSTTSVSPDPVKSGTTSAVGSPDDEPGDQTGHDDHQHDDSEDQPAAMPATGRLGPVGVGDRGLRRATPAVGLGRRRGQRGTQFGDIEVAGLAGLPAEDVQPATHLAPPARLSNRFCRMRVAATWSITFRRALPRTPASDSCRSADTVVSRSSTKTTGTGSIRAASRAP